MPWNVLSKMSLRQEFVELASRDGANMRALCSRFGISRKAGYKWLSRYRSSGMEGLEDQDRRPKHSPQRASAAVEALVLSIREQNPCWGGRKIRARLSQLGHLQLPSASTMTEILRRHGKLTSEESRKHTPFKRFERATPNELWQMDFKGWVRYEEADQARRCYPLTILDDHSRYSLCIAACSNEQRTTVQQAMISVFRHYGLPLQMTMDNGAPWGNGPLHEYTGLTVWLMHLGIRVSHSRPYHPQTQGKDERFHRTLKAEVLNGFVGHSQDDFQRCFDAWRHRYNHERPHEAIQDQVPASRYRPSDRTYPEQLPPIEYAAGELVRKVQLDGNIYFKGHLPLIGKAFKGYPVRLQASSTDGIFDAYFGTNWIRQFDLREAAKA